MMTKQYEVQMYSKGFGNSLKFEGVVAGMGKNAGTWDSTHGRTQAYAHMRTMRLKHPDKVFSVHPAS